MKNILISLAVAVAAQIALAEHIDPQATNFPWMNNPAHDARYRLADHPNTVFVFEAFSLSCSWCNKNAAQVDAMADQYRDDNRVQFVDLGLDQDARSYQSWNSQHNPNHPVVMDVGRKVYNVLQQDSGIPQTFVVACDGNLIGSTVGYWGAEEKQTIKNAIAEAKGTTCN